MKYTSMPIAGNSLVGLYAYSRGPVGLPIHRQTIRDFIYIEKQLAPGLFLVADLHIYPNAGIVSRRIVTLGYLRDCTFYETRAEVTEVLEFYVQKLVEHQKA